MSNCQVQLPLLLDKLLIPNTNIPALAITGLADDSRLVTAGNLFFAIPGVTEDGAKYAASAVNRGALAVVATRPLELDVPCLVTTNIRRAIALAGARYYNHPASRIDCVGVTGTNGKTTICHLVAEMMTRSGRPFGLAGTVGHRVGEKVVVATTTTPGPLEISRLLRAMADSGAQGCVMEVSSHALVQERTAGVAWRVGVFSNLSRDHLDYHGTMENYAAAKARLFASLEPGAKAVLNLGDRESDKMLAALGPEVEVIGFSIPEHPDATLGIKDLRQTRTGSNFTLSGPGGEVSISLPLVGEFNLENALAAASTGLALGLDLPTIAAALQEAKPAVGRCEEIFPGGPELPRVFIDYAHTPDALGRVLTALRPLTKGRLLVVFGCGGNRDQGKRSQMGEAASRLADLVWVTSDNPREEDPEEIIAHILDGVTKGFAVVEVEPDRERAIRLAVSGGRSNDILLIAGKGHEDYQIVGKEKLPFSDGDVARRYLCQE